jgi:hypothetical protein
VIGGIALQVGAAAVPVVSRLLGNAALPLELWGVVFGGAIVAWAAAEAMARVVWRDRAGQR